MLSVFLQWIRMLLVFLYGMIGGFTYEPVVMGPTFTVSLLWALQRVTLNGDLAAGRVPEKRTVDTT